VINSFVQIALTRVGHDVDRVTDGAPALDLIREKNYDVIFSDIKMPGLNGLDLYRIVEDEKPGLVKRIVFMTGAVLEKEIESFLRDHDVLILKKPFYLNQLLEMVDLVVQN
jgi:CheY-like chemotaxis protein